MILLFIYRLQMHAYKTKWYTFTQFISDCIISELSLILLQMHLIQSIHLSF